MSGEGGVPRDIEVLGAPLELPCGVVLKNRLVKAAMSDSLRDGAGDPTDEQIELYRRWARGGAAMSLIGEVQVDPAYPEKPGNLVLGPRSDDALLRRLAASGSEDGAHIWAQLGRAGALAHPLISSAAGPSALHMDGLHCEELPLAAVEALPSLYARAARHAQSVGFTGVEVHAGHGFLLSQFLSPLFNHRTDRYGGPIEARCRILLDIIRRIRVAVGSELAIGVRINSSDQLEGGLTQDEALVVVSLLGDEAIDLLDISGGTYFPGAAASSDSRSSGPYFLDFARQARTVTNVPLMVTGGFGPSARQHRPSPSGRRTWWGLPGRWLWTQTRPRSGSGRTGAIHGSPASDRHPREASLPGSRCASRPWPTTRQQHSIPR